jgi:hypothetical protein
MVWQYCENLMRDEHVFCRAPFIGSISFRRASGLGSSANDAEPDLRVRFLTPSLMLEGILGQGNQSIRFTSCAAAGDRMDHPKKSGFFIWYRRAIRLGGDFGGLADALFVPLQPATVNQISRMNGTYSYPKGESHA